MFAALASSAVSFDPIWYALAGSTALGYVLCWIQQCRAEDRGWHKGHLVGTREGWWAAVGAVSRGEIVVGTGISALGDGLTAGDVNGMGMGVPGASAFGVPGLGAATGGPVVRVRMWAGEVEASRN